MREDIIQEELEIAQERMRQDEQHITRVFQRQLREFAVGHPTIVVLPSTTVRDAIATMQRAQVGCVMVVDHERLVGIFTERDVLNKVAAQTLDVDHTPVSACMTRDPVCLSIDDELVYALNQMSLDGYRHMPLVDEQQRPIALVSIRAMIEALVEEFPQEILNIPPPRMSSRQEHPEGA